MNLLIIFGIGLAASFFGSFMSGGLSMISLSALIAFGFAPHVAIGTFAVGAMGFDIGGLTQYMKKDKVVWSMFWPLTIIGVIASLLGSIWVVKLDTNILTKVIGFSVLIFIPISLYNKKLGIVEKKVTARSKTIGYCLSAPLSFYGASIGVGYGLFSVFNKMYFFGLPLLKAKATGKLPNMIGGIASLVVFGISGVIDWQATPFLFAGMFMGSTLGTHYAIRLGDTWLRNILLVTIGLFSLKLILGL